MAKRIISKSKSRKAPAPTLPAKPIGASGDMGNVGRVGQRVSFYTQDGGGHGVIENLTETGVLIKDDDAGIEGDLVGRRWGDFSIDVTGPAPDALTPIGDKSADPYYRARLMLLDAAELVIEGWSELQPLLSRHDDEDEEWADPLDTVYKAADLLMKWSDSLTFHRRGEPPTDPAYDADGIPRPKIPQGKAKAPASAATGAPVITGYAPADEMLLPLMRSIAEARQLEAKIRTIHVPDTQDDVASKALDGFNEVCDNLNLIVTHILDNAPTLAETKGGL